MQIRNSFLSRIILVLTLTGTASSFTLFESKKLVDPVAAPNAFFDAQPVKSHYSYIYAPGMMGTEILMGRYCPEYTASTGEKISWKSGGHVIGSPHSGVIFSEIDLHKPTYFTLNPIQAFINTLCGDLFPFIQRIFQTIYNFTVVDNPLSNKTVVGYSFNFGRANLGQRNDLKILCRTYEAHLKKYPKTLVVLYGDSRGAATIFNFLATHKPQRVKAAILDGIFDSIPHCIKHFIYTDKDPRAEQRLHDIISFTMGGYSQKGPFPRDYISKMNLDIPLLFVTSLKDGLVDPQCTIYLYKELKKRGHQKVHLLMLEKSLHPCYMIGDADDRKMYEDVVHAFYKQYGLPYNTQRAAQGLKAFEKTQPTNEELTQKYQLNTCSLCQ